MPHSGPAREVPLFSAFYRPEQEAQRDEEVCPGPCSLGLAELGFEPCWPELSYCVSWYKNGGRGSRPKDLDSPLLHKVGDLPFLCSGLHHSSGWAGGWGGGREGKNQE